VLRTIAFLLVAFCLANRSNVVQAGTVHWSFFVSWVDIVDLNNVRNNFGASGLGDFTEDGKVDIHDLNFVRNSFGQEIPPRPTRIQPEAPTSAEVIGFHLQYGGGWNSCDATLTYGEPFLTIDPEQQAVQVGFKPVEEPIFCTGGIESVDGLDGTFGPLPAGRWTLGIAGQAPALQFDVVALNAVPEPGSWAIAVVGAGAIVTLRRRF
jgi:hypothetical protein